MSQVPVYPNFKKTLGFRLDLKRFVLFAAFLHRNPKFLRSLRDGRSSLALEGIGTGWRSALKGPSSKSPLLTPMRTVGLGIALLSLLVTGCGKFFAPDPQKEIQAGLRSAKDHYENHDYLGTIRAYESILQRHPEYADAHYQIALISDRNLNDFLTAAYHFQRYLESADMDRGKTEVVRGFLENAKLQFAATIPNTPSQNSPELLRLQTENAALHRQIDDLKRDLVQLRASKLKEPSPGPAETKTVNELQTQTKPKPERNPSSKPKTYTVKRGDGIQAIAERVYGDRRKWRDIMAANPNLRNPNQLKPGQVLNLP